MNWSYAVFLCWPQFILKIMKLNPVLFYVQNLDGCVNIQILKKLQGFKQLIF